MLTIVIFSIIVFGLFSYVIQQCVSKYKIGENEHFTSSSSSSLSPCVKNLTDSEYIEHMIPHHQVAIDISLLLQKKTTSPVMQQLIRKLIWVQKYEISFMREMLKTMQDNAYMSLSSGEVMHRHYMSTVADFTSPNKLHLTNTFCDPNFFNTKAHMKHMIHMNLHDKMYIEHMIPHHQVAVDMSKVLLKNTKNDMMIYLAYRIIQSQQEEIVLLNNLLQKENIKLDSDMIN